MDNLYDIDQVASLLGVTRRTVERAITKLAESKNPVRKIKVAGQRKYYYNQEAFAKIRGYIDQDSTVDRLPNYQAALAS